MTSPIVITLVVLLAASQYVNSITIDCQTEGVAETSIQTITIVDYQAGRALGILRNCENVLACTTRCGNGNSTCGICDFVKTDRDSRVITIRHPGSQYIGVTHGSVSTYVTEQTGIYGIASSSQQVVDNCLSISSCSECSATSACGWCSGRSNGVCISGNSSAPSQGATCPTWNYNDASSCPTCAAGFYGSGCNQFNCYGVDSANSSACGGQIRGSCTAPDTCTCSGTYAGRECEFGSFEFLSECGDGESQAIDWEGDYQYLPGNLVMRQLRPGDVIEVSVSFLAHVYDLGEKMAWKIGSITPGATDLTNLANCDYETQLNGWATQYATQVFQVSKAGTYFFGLKVKGKGDVSSLKLFGRIIDTRSPVYTYTTLEVCNNDFVFANPSAAESAEWPETVQLTVPADTYVKVSAYFQVSTTSMGALGTSPLEAQIIASSGISVTGSCNDTIDNLQNLQQGITNVFYVGTAGAVTFSLSFLSAPRPIGILRISSVVITASEISLAQVTVGYCNQSSTLPVSQVPIEHISLDVDENDYILFTTQFSSTNPDFSWLSSLDSTMLDFSGATCDKTTSIAAGVIQTQTDILQARTQDDESVLSLTTYGDGSISRTGTFGAVKFFAERLNPVRPNAPLIAEDDMTLLITTSLTDEDYKESQFRSILATVMGTVINRVLVTDVQQPQKAKATLLIHVTIKGALGDEEKAEDLIRRLKVRVKNGDTRLEVLGIISITVESTNEVISYKAAETKAPPLCGTYCIIGLAAGFPTVLALLIGITVLILRFRRRKIDMMITAFESNAEKENIQKRTAKRALDSIRNTPSGLRKLVMEPVAPTANIVPRSRRGSRSKAGSKDKIVRKNTTKKMKVMPFDDNASKPQTPSIQMEPPTAPSSRKGSVAPPPMKLDMNAVESRLPQNNSSSSNLNINYAEKHPFSPRVISPRQESLKDLQKGKKAPLL